MWAAGGVVYIVLVKIDSLSNKWTCPFQRKGTFVLRGQFHVNIHRLAPEYRRHISILPTLGSQLKMIVNECPGR